MCWLLLFDDKVLVVVAILLLYKKEVVVFVVIIVWGSWLLCFEGDDVMSLYGVFAALVQGDIIALV